jgi:hypothetical protein
MGKPIYAEQIAKHFRIDQLRFRLLNDDFAGRTTYDTAMLYRDGLREGYRSTGRRR